MAQRGLTDIVLSRRWWLHAMGSVAVSPLLAACGGGPAPTTYDLAPARDGLRRSGGRGTIVVPEPTAVAALDSDRIVIRAAAGELTYLPRAQWSDRLPRLVQARVVQTFENAGRAAVGRPGDRLQSTVQLLIDIRNFEVREATRDAFVECAAKLAGTASGRVTGARMFRASTPVSAIDGLGATAALDASLQQVMRDMTAWAGSA
jgi:cholesterol transport system auxiliary component